ncbi:2-succinyl-5-enolpyruvyl-6-hydroxy-3-cyclohexene-1-carboxylic-acid synthase [Nocardioides donggukensis]|uniref:2-succinyl-5-enolpyruvyl-6-hydroxy-3-cyclohexene-1-carboxylate synthase n=1 Tax=Nocardioides donggukensis TaxID=2774019 RepID=A0A927Q3Q2_9ACTN|nr:2-succinyl-5-enolpyruvyl-6-hydroxy-3-cyclohexene-1-carboxylic-acid synthase [Nocardioides donggukensis]MBD8870811.1 2-succinyl-5-enolpyruvyl-6-hydroxy-3-cyclohexene-1-carboxylic-acid synthase [Nocardioides donggukensis]
MTVSENPSTRLARGLVDALVVGGVTELVLAPGSRNAPLAFAAWEAARAGRLRLHTRVDERTGGFLALGMTRVGARAAVVCTSGTAVANLHPAVLEAAHSGLPLVLVTADRPASLRGTGASQTTDQVGIFGDAARFLDLAVGPPGRQGDWQGDQPGDPQGDRSGYPDQDVAGPVALAAEALGVADGPLHLNVQLVPPLVPDGPPVMAGPIRTAEPTPRAHDRARDVTEAPVGPEVTLPRGPRTVVVAGDDAGPPARVLAEAADWPLLAEPTSGARTGSHALRCYRLLLGGAAGGVAGGAAGRAPGGAEGLGERIERVVVMGHPTLSRPVTRLLEREDVEVVSVRPRGRWSQRPFPVDVEAGSVRVESADDPGWAAAWREADARLARSLDALLAAEPGITPYEVAGAVSAAVPPGGLLYVGASSPIRDLDLMVAPYRVGDRRRVVANRGLAGIDGTVSSAIGAALGRPHGSRSFALMGDVTFLHDAGGLVLGPDQPEPDLTIVVVNDDGGSIFAMLEQGDPRFAEGYDALFGTPHGVDLAALCAATRTPHWRVESLPELRQALDQPNGGVEVVEVRCRRDNRRELDERIRAL